MPTVYDRLGAALRRSKDLAGVLRHYRAFPDDMIIKVQEKPENLNRYAVTFYWPNHGHECVTHWEDWRVLLHWLLARRSWSIQRVTFDESLYDSIMATEEGAARFAAFRKSGNVLSAHAYKS